MRRLPPDPREAWQIAQGARCPCRGHDEMCPCQNARFRPTSSEENPRGTAT